LGPLSAASRLSLGVLSAASRLSLGVLSAASRLSLGVLSAASRLSLGVLSAASRLSLGVLSAASRLSLGVLSAFSRRSPSAVSFGGSSAVPRRRVIKRLQASLPFGETRPKLNRTLAILLFSVFGNTFCTLALIAAGVWVAGLLAGVPALPPGARVPFFGPPA